MQLRHQLQILSDAGVLNAPITTWPLSSRDIHLSLRQEESQNILPSVQMALNDINQRLREEDYSSNFKVTGKAHSKELLVRDFSGEGREKAQLSYDGEFGSPILDARLKLTVSDKSAHPDDQSVRLDESYIASSIGNWKFTVGKQSRWWGPGWDGSLILSNNARPIPSLSLDRIESAPFKNRFMRWMGPWKLSMFAGQLESTRHISHAKLLGARFNFKPTSNLEVGLNRTAQWGGAGRPQTLSSLFNAIIGNDNFYSSDPGKKTEPGNQLAGADFRWKSPIGKNRPYAVYGQIIGEDEAGYLPYKNIGLLGFETWGNSRWSKGNWRTYLELADTSTRFAQGYPRNNTAYGHSIYKDGYRHMGLSLGHGIDSDSRLVSAGAMLSRKNGDFWRVWAKHARLNEDGSGPNPIASRGKKWSALGVSLDKNLNPLTKLNLGLQLIKEEDIGRSSHSDLGVSIGVIRSF